MSLKIEKIAVELIDSMGSDQHVSNVARVSFAKWKSGSIDSDDVRLIKFLAKHGHWSPFAHCFLSVRIAVPLWMARQLVKHQVGLSWNEESRRYIKTDPSFWIPDVFHSVPEGSIKQGCAGIHPESDKYRDELILESKRHARRYKKHIAEGLAPEEARFFLPLNTMTHIVWSGSLMAFCRVVKQRSDAHAQLAINEFASLLAPIIKSKFPHAMSALLEQ